MPSGRQQILLTTEPSLRPYLIFNCVTVCVCACECWYLERLEVSDAPQARVASGCKLPDGGAEN